MLGLTDQHRQQLSLTDTLQTDEERQRCQKLMADMDALNEKMGKRAACLWLPEKNAHWYRRCANQSPRHTTHWDKLIKAYRDEGAAKRAIVKNQ